MTDDWTPIPGTGHRHFIDGAFTEPTSEATVAIVDPATEQTIATVPRATPADADAAIAAARRSHDEGPWQHLTSDQRADALDRFADALEARRGLLEAIALRQGGAVADLAKNLQTGFPLHMARRYAALARTFPMVQQSSIAGPPFGPPVGGRTARVVQRVPTGVVTAITPFNYPLLLNVQKVFPALAVGCSVILKPTPTTCLDADVMAEAAAEADLPPGVVNILLGGEPDVGEILVADPRVDLITFTGSTGTGKHVMRLAADQVKRVLLELGGKSPNIVFADADLDHWFSTQPGNLRHAGQGCGQLTRILVEESIYDEVVDRLATDMAKLVVGPPDRPGTDVGPVANARQYERVTNYIQIGVEEGARLVTGGGRPAGLDRGYYIEPTLFADVDNSMRIAREEIFGPVPVVIPFAGEHEAVAIANDSDYGINASVWSSDDDKARRVGGRILAGNVGVNCMANVTEGPHGGFKQTGIGREYWEWSLEEYVELRGLSLA